METENILGLDIGGANTKAAIVKFRKSEILESFSVIEYFPFWEKTLNDIPTMIKRIVENLIIPNNLKLEDINFFSVTILLHSVMVPLTIVFHFLLLFHTHCRLLAGSMRQKLILFADILPG